MEPVDVVIAGAGPNGLMLACELSLAGVHPVVLERLPGPGTEPRANGLVGQVVRMLDRRGLHERLSGSADPPQPTPGFVFGALPLDLTAVEDNPLHLLPVPQPRLVQVLAERADELGVEIRWGHELTAIAQDEDAVTVDVAAPGGPYRVRARHLVGADGGKSATRRLAGIGFPGVTEDRAVSRAAHVTVPAGWVSATGALDVPGLESIPPFTHHRTEHGLFVFAPFDDAPPLVSTVEWDPPADDLPMTLDEMRDSVGRVLGVGMPLGPPTGDGPHVLRRLTGGNSRIAERYRDGRVLLLGDAAHVHSAIGGSGLNLGLQDAVNLGWKLAAEIRGEAAPGLLDSYETERRPVSARVLMHTRAQSALIAPGSEVTALRELFAELLTQAGTAAHVAGLMAGADVRYDVDGGDPAAHPLVGRWAPDLVLEPAAGGGPVRLAELTRTARPLLLDLSENAALERAAFPWRHRVDVVAARPRTPAGATALLLRPDCYVAWASTDARPDPAGITEAVARWFAAGSRSGALVG